MVVYYCVPLAELDRFKTTCQYRFLVERSKPCYQAGEPLKRFLARAVRVLKRCGGPPSRSGCPA